MTRLGRIIVAVGGGVAAVGASGFVSLFVHRARSDQLAGQVAAALQSSFAAPEPLTVRAERGVVTLRGEVDDMRDIERLEAVARAVPGVVDVDNLIRLRLTGSSRPRVLTA